MKIELEIHDVNESLPKEGKSIFCFGEAYSATPSMGGAYWFKTHRMEPKSIKRSQSFYRDRFDKNGFVAAYVTHWCELPTKF